MNCLNRSVKKYRRQQEIEALERKLAEEKAAYEQMTDEEKAAYDAEKAKRRKLTHELLGSLYAIGGPYNV